MRSPSRARGASSTAGLPPPSASRSSVQRGSLTARGWIPRLPGRAARARGAVGAVVGRVRRGTLPARVGPPASSGRLLRWLRGVARSVICWLHAAVLARFLAAPCERVIAEAVAARAALAGTLTAL